MKILAIDDDIIVLASLSSLVKDYFGIVDLDDTLISSEDSVLIDAASDIETAHKFLEISFDKNQPYDIIFLDLSIDTKDDGYTLIPVIKSMFKNVFIVVISSNQDMKTVMAVDAMGVSGYIRKPITNHSKKVSQIIDRVIHYKELAKEMGLKR